MKAHFIDMPDKFPLKALLLVLPLLALLFTSGCSTPDYSPELVVPDSSTNLPPAARLHIGDTITITFDGLPPENLMPPVDKTINEDGTINLADIGSIKAAGLTTGELEIEITTNYVPRLLNHLSVTVTAGTRVYYVRGEVKGPGRQEYVGEITVTKAITSAGDFTDFADPTRVILIRSSGQRFTINCTKILNGDAPDPGVYPGDQIEVKRRRF
jgi:protein involved in polysaccharide export with SLBB domain